MAYTPIDPNTIKVGDPITKELLDLIESNFTDHEERINNNEASGGSVHVLNAAFHLGNLNTTDPVIFYYKAARAMDITDFRVQIFNKGSITTGTLSIDLEKSVDTNPSNFNSILSADVSFNFASAANYSEAVGTLTVGSEVDEGEVIRVKITGVPAGFNDKILIVIAGA